jgi:uncharacterized protein YijF (DUF1287 family)
MEWLNKSIILSLSLLASFFVTAGDDFYERLSGAAIDIVDWKVKYTPDYVSMPYPNGDVPANTGVCTDVVIRAYRKLGIDLQKEVHEDMKKNFSLYPGIWGLKKPDTNIDHRRVPNLMKFFSRHGEVLKITGKKEDYKPGDIVTWDLDNGRPHIGIVVDKKALLSGRYKVVHNIGLGQVMDDCLFDYKITGHYRYKK